MDMSFKPSAAPRFRKPPIAEISIGVRYSPLAEYSSAVAGLFWAELGEEFNSAADKAPLFAPNEPQVEWPSPRAWIIHKDLNWLIQLQRDRFLVNWRWQRQGDSYPAGTAILGAFADFWQRFVQLVDNHNLGELELLEFELLKQNHLFQNEAWASISRAGDVVRTLQWPSDVLTELGEPLSVGWSASFKFPECAVAIDIKTGTHKARDGAKVLNMDVRGQRKLNDDDKAAVTDMPSIAGTVNRRLNLVFTSLTDPAVQKEAWGRYE